MSVPTIQEVHQHVKFLTEKHKPEDILVAFDIDMTLIQPCHPAVAYPNLIKYAEAYKSVTKCLTPLQKDYLLTMLTQDLSQLLIEDTCPQVIQSIQALGAKAIALTSVLTGRIKGSKSIEKTRFDILKGLNIDFEQSYTLAESNFSEIDEYNYHYPVYYRGILCANGERGTHNKGTVLGAFFRRIQQLPKAVVMVDDKKRNLMEVEAYFAKHHSDINFIGIHYLGALHVPVQAISKAAFTEFWQKRVQAVHKI